MILFNPDMDLAKKPLLWIDFRVAFGPGLELKPCGWRPNPSK